MQNPSTTGKVKKHTKIEKKKVTLVPRIVEPPPPQGG
jgi:hypothetical protein